MRYRFVFWQFAPNEHEAGYIERIAELGYECFVVFQNDISEDRKRLGVVRPNLHSVNIFFCGDKDELPNCINFTDANDVHVFTGIRAFSITKRAFNVLRKTDARLILVSESRRTTGLLGCLRWLDSYFFERKIRRRINAVFAMGELGVRWFRSVGYSKNKIYEFCYALGNISCDANANLDVNDNVIRIAFVGQFIRRKRVDLLISAFCELYGDNKRSRLVLVGDGVERCSIEKIIKEKKLEKVCEMKYPISNKNIKNFFSEIDLLVLPSDWDGWGAVVNESLRAGVPVIVSDKCGASTLSTPGVVDVFRSGNGLDLVKKLKSFNFDVNNKRETFLLSEKISGKMVGDYFIAAAVFNEKINPPWRCV